MGGLTDLETFTWQCCPLADRVTLPSRLGNPLDGSPHLSCKRDQDEIIDYMDRRVTQLGGLLHLSGAPHLLENSPSVVIGLLF